MGCGFAPMKRSRTTADRAARGWPALIGNSRNRLVDYTRSAPSPPVSSKRSGAVGLFIGWIRPNGARLQEKFATAALRHLAGTPAALDSAAAHGRVMWNRRG